LPKSIAFTMTMPRETFSRLVASARARKCAKGYVVRLALDAFLDAEGITPAPGFKTTAERRQELTELRLNKDLVPPAAPEGSGE
jgi:hypothetical protein